MSHRSRVNRVEVADRLHSVVIHMLRALRTEDESSGLSPARLSALSVVVFGGPIRLSALAAAEGVQPPTMSRLAGALEDDGLIARSADPEDGRSMLLKATDAGRDLLLAARSRRLDRLVETLADLDDSSWLDLERSVEILSERFTPRGLAQASRDGDPASSPAASG